MTEYGDAKFHTAHRVINTTESEVLKLIINDAK
jgi:hypothetical protein